MLAVSFNNGTCEVMWHCAQEYGILFRNVSFWVWQNPIPYDAPLFGSCSNHWNRSLSTLEFVFSGLKKCKWRMFKDNVHMPGFHKLNQINNYTVQLRADSKPFPHGGSINRHGHEWFGMKVWSLVLLWWCAWWAWWAWRARQQVKDRQGMFHQQNAAITHQRLLMFSWIPSPKNRRMAFWPSEPQSNKKALILSSGVCVCL